MSLVETSEIGMISSRYLALARILSIPADRRICHAEELKKHRRFVTGTMKKNHTVPTIPEKEQLREDIAESSLCITTEYSLISTDSFVGAGRRGDLDLDLDLDVSSKKVLDDLNEILFLILDQGGKLVEREPQGLIFRKKVNIAITTLLVAVILIALTLSFMEDECPFSPHLIPT
ncbi:hypothetical protein ZOSMA_110G00090 [Zostera marina]|uniref:Uncharacterized protein n=1 Tax=Zostera marina TaxID=29655 RepID=A0A0K9Q358_ZOSMR|nr:hypothetical protein ZOSMA_110G00090 [Zostera marina]